ncbi:MAG: succinylglutamate desuccinylase/aspartoacylase family protein [Candidatus Methylacidiphilales bacterium]|nr:succinylglutamate desuccinylase/aspartoacylase family protein [Candidatus Methylacidiphilales bacterium]
MVRLLPAATHRALRNRRAVSDLTARARALAARSGRLFYSPLRPVDLGAGRDYAMPRFLFIGPGQGAAFLRLGIFAGIHGDEEAGCLAAMALLEHLVAEPEHARGYEIFIYPVCNPTGYEDGTRFNRRGADLNREFWKQSFHPEVRVLEEELSGMHFDGLVALHADDTSEGTYGFVRGAALTRHVLLPALEAAEAHLPRNSDRIIDGFQAANGIITGGYGGILSAPPQANPQPFEIVFETPQMAPLGLQVGAHVAALLSVLETYRSFISYGQDL